MTRPIVDPATAPAGARRGRRMALTAELVGRVHREVADPGPAAHWRELTEPEFVAHAHRLVGEAGGAPLWLFAYGSLIWNPVFEHEEHLPARAHGWRRSYCLGDERWRATPETPGLILSLDLGGSCQGVAYRLRGDDLHGQMLQLLYREAAYEGDFDHIRWIRLRAGGQSLRALTFWAAPRSDPAYLKLSDAEQAARLARAVGHLGSAAEYLHNTVTHLEALGIRDSYLWRMQRLVAAEIQRAGAGGKAG